MSDKCIKDGVNGHAHYRSYGYEQWESVCYAKVDGKIEDNTSQ